LRPELATEEIVVMLGHSKCRYIMVGVESGSERVRKDILERNYSNQLLIQVAERIHKQKLKLKTLNMVGLPSETEEEIWETINVNKIMRTEIPMIAIWMPFPGSRLTEKALAMDCLDASYASNLPNSFREKTILKGVDGIKIKNYCAFFDAAVFFKNSEPLIRRLVQTEPNIVVKLWYHFIHVIIMLRLPGYGLFSQIKAKWGLYSTKHRYALSKRM
jgi:radical SAM superfamily enzyme YgiQ (UPF0313 family)